MSAQQLLAPILNFLQCSTPQAWLDEAKKPENLKIILIDHLLCELKAAQSAMFLIRKYAVDKQSNTVLLEWFKPYENFAYRKEGDLASLKDKNKLSKSIIAKNDSPYGADLIDKMVLLIKEELHHFYQVLEIMENRGIAYENITAGRYAKGMLKHVKTYEPDALVDKLIIGAYIEARSCERFAALAPFVDKELATFYISLLRSESRHYQDYLTLAEEIAQEFTAKQGKQSKKYIDVSIRIKFFGEIEAELIQSADEEFKFHSGVPVNNEAPVNSYVST
ncbi:MAG: tRNA-(ms[2]io[6]A)-hydroxylase [Alteromonadaceae bacterium]|nr:tRNA-(ms[2]io[6]A)-hydroxylase [Alteromonadaceae bacterium]